MTKVVVTGMYEVRATVGLVVGYGERKRRQADWRIERLENWRLGSYLQWLIDP